MKTSFYLLLVKSFSRSYQSLGTYYITVIVIALASITIYWTILSGLSTQTSAAESVKKSSPPSDLKVDLPPEKIVPHSRISQSQLREIIAAYARKYNETPQEFAARVGMTTVDIEAWAGAAAESGYSAEAMVKSIEGLSKSLKDPGKVRLMECMGIEVHKYPNQNGHPPTALECQEIRTRYNISN